MRVLKFGGKSLSNGIGIDNVISIIKDKYTDHQPLAVILSARADTTDRLESFLERAKNKENFNEDWQAFKKNQILPYTAIDLSEEFSLLENIFQGVRLVEDYSLKIKDLVLSQGEIMSCKIVTELLRAQGLKVTYLDSRRIFKTDNNFGAANVDQPLSEQLTKEAFAAIPSDTITIVSGYIASNAEGTTTTLGRNGSNYSASLLANYLDTDMLDSYTHLDGIYTANPDILPSAQTIAQLDYIEASEIASFGASILHPKTIQPIVEKEIPLRILNTYNPDSPGTLISSAKSKAGVKSISVQQNVSLIHIEGKGLLGKVGIDARIFSNLQFIGVSIGLISQGSSERGISFTIGAEDESRTIEALRNEFQYEIANNDIHNIVAESEISVITVIGIHVNQISDSLDLLNQNKVKPLLINNTTHRNNVSLVVRKKDENKSIHLMHSQIFGVSKRINIAIVGVGNVGGTLIDQIIDSQETIEHKRGIDLHIFAIANSRKIHFEEVKLGHDWKGALESAAATRAGIAQDIIEYAHEHHLENLMMIDNTANADFVSSYPDFVEHGFDIISSNKIANTQTFEDYAALRHTLKKHGKEYLYETNVGAGLPIIDTIKLLHQSAENITRIKGVFSGSLSYIFNEFSGQDLPFSEVLQRAIDMGYTEPDPREDLCGNDVARKLLILARELELENEFEDINIENLIPSHMEPYTVEEFLGKTSEMDTPYADRKKELEEGYVLRYVGELHGDLQQSKGLMDVKLVAVPSSSALGGLKGSDSLIEIYTESYGDNPITIIGAGAGAKVTARGVFGDVLRIAGKK